LVTKKKKRKKKEEEEETGGHVFLGKVGEMIGE
jgi:hypothetical protein